MNIPMVVRKLKSYAVRNRRLTILYVICLALVLIPIVVMANLIIRYSVNVPWWDQLSFVDLMAKQHAGTLNFYDLWKQHNEHRLVVAQSSELVLGWFTGYNFRVPVFLNLLTVIGSFCFLISLLRRTFDRLRTVALLAVPFAWILFTPFQWVNWIWGFQWAFFLCVFFTIYSIWLLTGKGIIASQKLFALIVIAATITTYCNGNGLLIWPIGLGILLWRGFSRKRLYIWSGVGLVVIASYLYKFRRSPDSPPLLVVLREPMAVTKYSLIYLGRIFASTQTASLYVGLGLVVLFGIAFWYIYKRGASHAIISWTALAAYVLLTALLAAASRLNQGVSQSFLSNSYPTISLLFILATLAVVAYALGLWVREFKPQKLQSYLVVLFALGILVALPLPAFIQNYSKGVFNFKDLSTHLHEVQHCVYTARSEQDPCLIIVYPDPQIAWNDIQTLRQLHWGGF